MIQAPTHILPHVRPFSPSLSVSNCRRRHFWMENTIWANKKSNILANMWFWKEAEESELFLKSSSADKKKVGVCLRFALSFGKELSRGWWIDAYGSPSWLPSSQIQNTQYNRCENNWVTLVCCRITKRRRRVFIFDSFSCLFLIFDSSWIWLYSSTRPVFSVAVGSCEKKICVTLIKNIFSPSDIRSNLLFELPKSDLTRETTINFPF